MVGYVEFKSLLRKHFSLVRWLDGSPWPGYHFYVDNFNSIIFAVRANLLQWGLLFKERISSLCEYMKISMYKLLPCPSDLP